MDANMLKMLLLIVGGVFVVIVVAYLIIANRLKKNTKYVASLVEGTKEQKYSMEIFYQKFYIFFSRIPFVRRYVFKVRRRLEIINLEDEYLTRLQTAQIMLKVLVLFVLLAIICIVATKENMLLRCILLLFELFFIEMLASGMVDKIDNNLLRSQIDFFAEIRHAYHEFNMVEEAIYDVAQNDEIEVARQAEKIYEVLISDDPENELEKYYDIAPNSYLKEFAGISYLTKEFGDRKDKDGASLYLKNLNNITQEMQLEILKRDKLDYVFQSLSMIAAVPILFLETIKNWAVQQFSFTTQFYNGSLGLYTEIAIVILTIVCFYMTRILKDNGSVTVVKNTENPWQAKLYAKKPIQKFVNLFIPKNGTKEHRKISKILKDAASKLKMEWLYINRLVTCVVCAIATVIIFTAAHAAAVNYVRTEPVADYDLMGTLSAQEEKKALELTAQDNIFIDMFEADRDVTVEDIKKEMVKIEYYEIASEELLEEDAQRIFEKIKTVQKEFLKWFEVLLAMAVGVLGYFAPVWLLIFQAKLRQLEMENEVMQFQTIILMLMKIERVNVEMILEWLERYSNIFREPISKCVNNFESGAWEALEELKNDVTFAQLIRIVEALQAAVEKIPIREAFDELDTERAYHQEKRKESNERLISRKAMIGKVIGFGPMVILFVGYLIIPLCLIGMTAMTESFDTMSEMM